MNKKLAKNIALLFFLCVGLILLERNVSTKREVISYVNGNKVFSNDIQLENFIACLGKSVDYKVYNNYNNYLVGENSFPNRNKHSKVVLFYPSKDGTLHVYIY